MSDQKALRRYLLHRSSDDERDTIEQEYFADEAGLDAAAAEEDALIEDYLTQRLSADDRAQFERQCKIQAVPYPFGHVHIDVSNLFALAHNLPEQLDIIPALEYAKLPIEGATNRAHHTARNVARLLISILERCR